MKLFNKHQMKLVLKLTFVFIIIHALVVTFYWNIDSIIPVVEQISLLSFTILMGIIIASVGIIAGTITKTYEIILDIDIKKFQNRSNIYKNKFLTSSKSTFLEIEDNTLLLIKLYVANLIVLFFLKVDFNLISSPIFAIYYPLFAKEAILTSLDIFIIFVGIWIIYDIVLAMFTIQKTHIEALELHVKLINDNDTISQK